MSETQLSISYENMLGAGMHFGRRKTAYNPKMKPYIFTFKEGIAIIDLLRTQAELKSVISALDEIIKNNGTVLFVGLTRQSADGIRLLADNLGMPYVLDRWLGGTLTNFKVISKRVKMLEDMENQLKTGELDKYTKKERLMFEKELKKMESGFGGLRKLVKLPDAVFVSSLKESGLPVREAKRLGIKVFAIANTDGKPEEVSQIIPANDKSKKSIDLILSAIKNEIVKSK